MVHRSLARLRHAARSAVVLGAVVLSVLLGWGPTSAQEASPVAADCNVDQAMAEAPAVYTVNGEESTASYTAQEELASVGAAEAVGTTNAIIGSILLDENNVPLACSNFAVDMRTMESDESKRDNYLRENVLESETYPYATFVVAYVTGAEEGLQEGETATVQLVGDLTIHGVTKTVTWDAEVMLEGESITGTATTTFLIADYGMEKPIVGQVVSIEDEIVLNVEITAALDSEA
jgi:polyisoprenoid-binding protein YceI